jgi:hypothetical protein
VAGVSELGVLGRIRGPHRRNDASRAGDSAQHGNGVARLGFVSVKQTNSIGLSKNYRRAYILTNLSANTNQIRTPLLSRAIALGGFLESVLFDLPYVRQFTFEHCKGIIFLLSESAPVEKPRNDLQRISDVS